MRGKLIDSLRCIKTTNLCGTDTWPIGKACQCVPCQAYVVLKDLAEAKNYMIYLVGLIMPEAEPCDTLAGMCTQIDHAYATKKCRKCGYVDAPCPVCESKEHINCSG